MEIKEVYQSLKHVGELSPREYIDVRGKQPKPLQIKHKRRETFFTQLQKGAKKLPGPGKYMINPEDPKIAKKISKKINFQQESKKPMNNFIDQLIKKQKGIPGVGKYQLEIDHTEKIRQIYEIKGNRQRKQAPIFRPTIFYDNQLDCINVGPGTYNTLEPLGRSKSHRIIQVPKIQTKEDKDKKGKDKKKGSQSLPKLPNPQSYNPIPSHYNTFDLILSQSDKIPKNSNFSKKKRFSAPRDLGPGPKYSLMSQWSPKKNVKNPGINYFKNTKDSKPQSVYH